MSKVLRISVLIFALTCSVSAGEIPNNVTGAPPPSQPAPAVQAPTTDGDIETGVTATTADGYMGNGAAATFIEVLLNLLALS